MDCTGSCLYFSNCSIQYSHESPPVTTCLNSQTPWPFSNSFLFLLLINMPLTFKMQNYFTPSQHSTITLKPEQWRLCNYNDLIVFLHYNCVDSTKYFTLLISTAREASNRYSLYTASISIYWVMKITLILIIYAENIKKMQNADIVFCIKVKPNLSCTAWVM